ncbi:hypothetical protein EG329_013025 [Mollisiaceae sp. DMI_Dod_QoI]|nr:hypothetical protein EG329_013025 [Helotiales sp. DMI_Dod_QoI]
MTANIDTILLIGATSGIGEAFARYFHSKGKRVIAAGRRLERLNALKSELKGLETFQMDVEDIPNIESKLTSLFKTYPDLDSVFVVSGIMSLGLFKDPSTTSAQGIVSEVTTNLIAPMVIARTVIPHLLALKRPTTFMTVTSGLAYIPLPLFPVYEATKIGVHNFTVVLRTQLAGTNVNVIEVAPPYVATDLDSKFKAKQDELQGGEGHPPMPLKDYMEVTTKQLEEGKEKELATGFSAMGVSAWRGAFQPLFDQFGLTG